MNWSNLGLVLISIALVAYLAFFVKNQQARFSWSNFNKTLSTLGLLGLGLIILIAACVLLLQ